MSGETNPVVIPTLDMAETTSKMTAVDSKKMAEKWSVMTVATETVRK